VKAIVLAQLGVKSHRQRIPLTRSDRMPVDLRENLHAETVL
jgi:hypothetical protein